MLYYPKIPGSKDCPDGRCIAFEKLDGTNLHWEWDRDFGWHAFGTRRDRFNLTPDGEAFFAAAHPGFADAPQVFRATLAGGLDDVLRSHPAYRSAQAVTAFTEYLGPNSFAGLHRADDPKRTVLIDVRIEGAEFVPPDRFVDDFGHLPTPRVVYRGRLTRAFAEAVRAGKYGVAEGVVCKGVVDGDVWRVKIKTYAYLERLKRAFADRWEDYWE
jgi:hypothetical protein